MGPVSKRESGGAAGENKEQTEGGPANLRDRISEYVHHMKPHMKVSPLQKLVKSFGRGAASSPRDISLQNQIRRGSITGGSPRSLRS